MGGGGKYQKTIGGDTWQQATTDGIKHKKTISLGTRNRQHQKTMGSNEQKNER